MGRTIEWPKGSGVTADYERHEEELVRDLLGQHDAGEITGAEFKTQMDVIHDLKVMLDARILPDAQAEVDAAPMQETFFQAPPLRDPSDNRVGKFHSPLSNAPETERRAAILVYPNTGTARRRVLDYIAAQAERGATDEEVSIALDMRLYTAAPRRNELLADGWVVDSGRRRETTTGTDAVVWVLTAAGKEQLA